MIKKIIILLCVTFSLVSFSEVRKSSNAAFSIAKSSNNNDIVEVEWLQSTGIQYILLEDVLADGIDIYVLPEKTRSVASAPFNRWNGGSRMDSICFMTVNDRGWTALNMSLTGIFTFDMTYEMKHIVVHGTSILIDNIEYSMGNKWGSYGGASKYYFALFGCYNQNANTVTCQSCKIGKCKIYCNEELKYSFIPIVFVNEKNIKEGAMYDEQSDKLFRNQGTGNFVIGPKVK